MAEYIERESFFRFLTEQKDKETGAYSKGRNAGLDVARSALRNREITPAADVVEVVHGEWEHDSVGFDDFWRCSACREDWFFDYDPETESTRVNYCPNCGAKMDGERRGT